MASVKVKVALRVRPFNRREIELDTTSVISMKDNQTFLQTVSDDKNDPSRKGQKVFTFDLCFDSLDPSSSSFASQETVFSALGSDILENVFMGYNACIFAYGQTGSGKSYTMMGSRDSPGIIPRLCNSLFDGISRHTCDDLDFRVQVSYMEIYNEKVHDLLDPCDGRGSLKVREHSLLGPYVDGLSILAVSSFDDIERLINEGNKSRTVAATNMNSESSRSHAVFTLLVTQTLSDRQSGVSGEKVSRVSLVDLAGSERAVKTGAVGERLKEGSNINRSLTTLGLVISKLADSACASAAVTSSAAAAATTGGVGGGKLARARDIHFIPYRDSVLTWLLKDNLGGNSKTIMVATVSPSADNYAETLSTLRYADRAKRIVNHAVVNEDPNAKIIRELRKEVEELRQQLLQLKVASGDDEQLREKLDENEKIMQQMSEPWEQKLQKTERLQHERQQALERMGISVQAVGIGVQKNKFYLVNLNADPAMNELLVYYLKQRTVVGLPPDSAPHSAAANDIQLSGLGIRPVHCVLTVDGATLHMEPAAGARCCVNGAPVLCPVQLQHGDRLVWGNNHFFRVNCPRPADTTASTPTSSGTSTASACLPASAGSLVNLAVQSSSGCSRNIDYAFARQELISNEFCHTPLHSAIECLEQRRRPEHCAASRHTARRLRGSVSSCCLQTSGSTLDLSSRQSCQSLSLSTSTADLLWSEEREDLFRRSLAYLKQEIVRANALVREAMSMAEELGEQVSFSVTLQIPPYNLTPNCHRSAFACEPAVLVQSASSAVSAADRNYSGAGAAASPHASAAPAALTSSVWSMACMEQRVADMRELYGEWKTDGVPLHRLCMAPFRPEQHGDRHQLIGVANVFLEVLLHDVRLSYHVPILSQQAEVVGRLHVSLERVAGSFYEPDSAAAAAGHSHCDSISAHTSDSDSEPDQDGGLVDTVTCRVTVLQATGLTAAVTGGGGGGQLVFCQYNFWGCSDTQVCAPVVIRNGRAGESYGSGGGGVRCEDNSVVRFHHCRDFVIPVCEEFADHCAEGALSIEVWAHRSGECTHSAPAPAAPLSTTPTTRQIVDSQEAQARSLADRWAELSRHLQLSVQILELDDQGQYRPVEVLCRAESSSTTVCHSNDAATDTFTNSSVSSTSTAFNSSSASSSLSSGSPSGCEQATMSGGVYQLRQGQQRRLLVRVLPVPDTGTLPLLCDTVVGLSIGSVVHYDAATASCRPPLDSYQEHGLSQLRQLWTAALDRRRRYLDAHLQAVINKPQKSGADAARERSLLEQWVQLSEERNAVLVPAPASGIPGAPLAAHVRRRAGTERHTPVLFLNLNGDDLTVPGGGGDSCAGSCAGGGRLGADDCSSSSWCLVDDEDGGSVLSDPVPAGLTSCLSSERGELMVPLTLVRVVEEPELVAVAQWDSSVHDSVHLNRANASGECVYLVLRVDVRLSQPYPMDITLRKRLCVHVYKPSFTSRLLKSIGSRRCDVVHSTSVVYHVVSNVPPASEQLEQRQSLARMAAAGEVASSEDGGLYVEKYLHGVGAVEKLLRLDRLRQSVLVKELLQASMKLTGGGAGLRSGGLMRKTASVPNISLFGRGDTALPHSQAAYTDSLLSAQSMSTEPESSGLSLRSCPAGDPGHTGGVWPRHPAPSGGARMSTLHEVDDGESGADAGPCARARQSESYSRGLGARAASQRAGSSSSGTIQRLRFSHTFDSLVEIPGQLRGSSTAAAGSAASSGYGSQTVSSTSLLTVDSGAEEATEQQPQQQQLRETDRKQEDCGHDKRQHPREQCRQDSNEQMQPAEVCQQQEHQHEEEESICDSARLQQREELKQVIDQECEQHDFEQTEQQQREELTQEHSEHSEQHRHGDGEELSSEKEAVNDSETASNKELSIHSHSSSNTNAIDAKTSHDTANSNSEKHHVAEMGDLVVASSLTHSLTTPADDLPAWVRVGEPVLVRPQSHAGIIRYVGGVRFAAGLWVGVELQQSLGRNDGSVHQVAYFSCRPRHGVFVRIDKLIWDHRRRRRLSPGANTTITRSSTCHRLETVTSSRRK